MVKRRVSLFGATGSIGASAIDLLERHKNLFEIVTVSANGKAHELAKIARRLAAKRAVVADENAYATLRDALEGTTILHAAGESALVEAAQEPVDLVIMAISGTAALRATFAAAKTGCALALANKESVVCAGPLLMDTIRASNTRLLPIDSEHNALFQLLQGHEKNALKQVTLTASGGPFRDWPAEKIADVTPEAALKHPVWNMGSKISIDCATMMNKGLELIEAQHIFSLVPAQMDILVHPQSVVHALIAFADGSTLAQMAVPDMRVAISNCLHWPNRMESGVAALDLASLGALTFEKPDEEKFPCLRLAREAMGAGGAMPCVLGAANEIAVEAFLHNRLSFYGISQLIESTMEKSHSLGGGKNFTSLDDVLLVEKESRRLAASLLPQRHAKPARIRA